MAARRSPKGRKRRVNRGFIKKIPPATSKKGGGSKGPGQVKVRGYTRRGSGKVSTPVAVRAYVRAGGGRVVGGAAKAPSGARKSSSGTGTIGVPDYSGPKSAKKKADIKKYGGGYGDYGAFKAKQKAKGTARKGTGTIGAPKFGRITTDPSWSDPGLAKKKRQQKARKVKHAVGRRSGGKSW
jgi:hypothetical protein